MNLGSLTHFLKSCETAVHGFVVRVFGQSAIDAFEQKVKTLLTKDVLQIITDAVQAAESLQVGGSAASGAQKREAAFNQITSDLKGQGITLETNLINWGIELVVGLLNAKSTAA